MRTRHLMAKLFCYRRQFAWDTQDDLTPLISLTTVKTLHSELKHRPPSELQRAAHDLGIDLAQAGLHEY